MITNREARDTRIAQYNSDPYDLGGASQSKLDWMADAVVTGMRRDSHKQ